jgi:hypothetical protein
MFKNEIAVSDKESAMKIANILVDEEYCVMLSREEDLYIINFEYSEYSDRNNVVFMNREDFEQKFEEIIKE